MTKEHIEILSARLFKPRQNLIIPNVSWGFGVHECDLLVVSGSGYLTEIEIKISKSDLKKDLDKSHAHESKKIRYLYFAIPEKLLDCTDLIPERAGIICCYKNKREITGYSGGQKQYVEIPKAKIIRKATPQTSCKPIDDKDRYVLARLGALRIWGLKEKLHEQTSNNK